MIDRDVLVYDIESATPNGKSDIDSHIMRIFGCYSYKTNKYYLLTDKEQIYRIINMHRVFVAFNNFNYDNKVMHKNGYTDIIERGGWGDYKFNNYKINIDMWKIFKDRAGAMKVGKNMLKDVLMSYSLDYISETIGIVDKNTKKIDNFDYSLLNKEVDEWTDEERKLISDYTLMDLKVTKRMYEWLEDYFKDFKDYIEDKDARNKKYLTTSTASFAYKAICKAMNWEEEYESNGEKNRVDGGYVSYPAEEEFDDIDDGDIYCMDFNSLYPSIMHQCNMYNPDNDGWSGEPLFHTAGMYNNKELGKVEKLLRKWYEQRVVFKIMKDSREYSIKIIINTIYGVLLNSAFKKLYNNTAGGDVTRIGRQWVLLARKRFREAGYTNIYSDTDSCYLVDPFRDKQRLLDVKDKLIEEIFSSVPFPYKKHKIGDYKGKDIFSGFDMGVDAEIQNIWFFKGGNKEKELELDEDDIINKPKGFMKKNYIYLKTDGGVEVKNLGVRKKSNSALSRKIFWDYMVKDGKIKNEKKVKFPKIWFKELIDKLLLEDIKLACIRYDVNKTKHYKSTTSIQYQISSKYGPGLHFLIPNFKLGVGKGKKYCTIEEFNENNLTIEDINLNNVWNELNYFIVDSDKIRGKSTRKQSNNGSNLSSFF